MLTVKDVKRALEGKPDNAEVRYLIEGESPLDDAWELANVVFIEDVIGGKTMVVLTNGLLKHF